VRYRRDRPCRTVKFTVGWRRGLGCWKHRGNLPIFFAYCAMNNLLLHSCTWLFPRLYSASQLFGQELRDQAERIRAICARCASPPTGPSQPGALFSWANANPMPSWRAYFHVAPSRADLLAAAVAAVGAARGGGLFAAVVCL